MPKETRKERHNYHLSLSCIDMLHECCYGEGLSQTAVIEQAVREYYALRSPRWGSFKQRKPTFP